MGITAEELLSLRSAHFKTSFIYIMQARKDGAFKGDNRYTHDAHIQIPIAGQVPCANKTRFSKLVERVEQEEKLRE